MLPLQTENLQTKMKLEQIALIALVFVWIAAFIYSWIEAKKDTEKLKRHLRMQQEKRIKKL